MVISKSLVIYEANPNDITTRETVAPITKPTQGAACEGDTRVRTPPLHLHQTSHLPPQVLVVRVTHVQALGGEGVRLDLHVRPRDLVDEAGLANVWKTCEEKKRQLIFYHESNRLKFR